MVSAALNVPVVLLIFNLVLPCPLNPVPPGFSPLILSAAKYVNEFNHSALAPFLRYKPTEFGTINVHSLKSNAASAEVDATPEPSINAPLPASPALYPLGSWAVIPVPTVITLQRWI